MPYSETRRQIVHVTMVGWAFLLRFLSWPQAAALAATALAFNAYLLPRLGGRAIFRPSEVARGVPAGILLYPTSVLLLILWFRERLDLAATAWAILAVGDGMATLVGRSAGRSRIPWNPEKTWEGTCAFAVCASAAGILLCWWTQPNIAPSAPLVFILAAPALASIAAALVETIPVRLDDNVSVPFAAGSVLSVLSLVDAGTWSAMAPGAASRLPAALLVNAAFGATAYAEGAVTKSGLAVGVVIGTAVYLGAGWEGWAMLFATFAAAAITSRVGLARKTALGIQEERGGRRGAGNALANCLVGAVAALAAIATPYQSLAWLVMVAALVAGGADTVASEIGKAYGRRTFLIVGLRPVPPGTPGAISLEGSLANLAAAVALGAVGVAGGLVSVSWLPIVVVAALAGSVVESVLGATLEGPGILDNDLLNFVNTFVAAAVALGAGGWDLHRAI